jgi:diamine N-acetyltransferase
MNAADDCTNPVINFETERLAFGPLRRDLVPLYQQWVNDFETMRTYGVPRPVTEERAVAWYDGAVKSETTIRFTVYERATMQPIGKAGLYDIDLRNRRAEYGILIGAREARGKGYGTEITRIMLDYGFTILGLHNIFLEVAGFNEAGMRAYGRAGFQEIGRRREAFVMKGTWYDKVFMDCLSTEFGSAFFGKIHADTE